MLQVILILSTSPNGRKRESRQVYRRDEPISFATHKEKTTNFYTNYIKSLACNLQDLFWMFIEFYGSHKICYLRNRNIENAYKNMFCFKMLVLMLWKLNNKYLLDELHATHISIGELFKRYQQAYPYVQSVSRNVS